MYQALYRKYRPKCFSDVVGQEHITETLRRQIVSDRLSHAYLFVGTRGTGKTTCAKILSRAVNCMDPVDGEPCNKCMFCVGIEEGSILDVLELDAASNNSVDNVRELRDEAIYSPAVVKKRVYIVDEVHMLSVSAFNALLKILEEPPEHILFVLATTELHKVPATIQSRCQKFSFKRLSPAVIASRLVVISDSEGLSLTAEAADKLAALADGAMRDGISLLDQCASGDVIDLKRVQDTLGLTGQEELVCLVGNIADRDIVSALGLLNSLYDDGRDMASLLNEVTSLMRDLLVFKLSPDSGLLANTGFDKAVLSELSKEFSPERLFFCLDVLKTVISGMSRSGSTKLTVELCLIKMCDERLSDDPVALLSRISRLENGAPTLTPSVNISSGEPPASITATGNTVESKTVESDGIVEHLPDSSMDNKTDEPSPCLQSACLETDEPSLAGLSPCPASPCPNDFWAGILEFLKGEPSVRVLLSDSSKVKALLKDRALTVNFTDSYTADQVRHSFSELIKEAAKSVLEHDVVLHIEVVDSFGSEDNKRDKLDSLSAFVSSNFD